MPDTIYHFTYKVNHKSGKYYVGRHSTNNLNDGYLGSGKWVRTIKDKDTLTREIIDFYDTFDELLEAENKLIAENIDNELNMNFNNNSIGFAFGDLHPNKDPENNPMYGKKHTNESRQKMIQNRKTSHSKNFKGKNHSDEWKQMMSSLHKGKNVSDETRKKISEKKRNRPNKTCPHCNVEMNPANYGRYHGDNCKHKDVE